MDELESDREEVVARLRVIIEWISNDLREHWRAVELDEVVHELEVHAARTGQPYVLPLRGGEA